jgi:hypothetical protein
MSNDFRYVRRAAPQRKAPAPRFAAGVVIAYSVIVLGLTAFLGSRIYAWSLQNTVENSVLATVVAWLDAPATMQSAAPGAVAAGNGRSRGRRYPCARNAQHQLPAARHG